MRLLTETDTTAFTGPSRRELAADASVSHFRARGASHPLHVHEHLQVMIPVQASASMGAVWERASGGFDQQRLTVGSSFLTCPGQPHTLDWEGDGEFVSLVLGPRYLDDVEASLSPRVMLEGATPVLNDPVIAHLGAALAAEFRTGELPASMYLESVAAVIAGRLARQGDREIIGPTPAGALDRDRLRRVTDYVRDHLDDDLSLDTIAREVGLSPFHFARSFRRATGMTLHQHVVGARIERAKELLTLTSLSIAEIALAAGFGGQSHFTTQFRRHVGTTPAVYRGGERRAAS